MYMHTEDVIGNCMAFCQSSVKYDTTKEVISLENGHNTIWTSKACQVPFSPPKEKRHNLDFDQHICFSHKTQISPYM